MSAFWVNGIVAMRDKHPYIQLSNTEGIICQLSLPEARQIAMDIISMAARTEMDAMLVNYCAEHGSAPNLASAMLVSFRDFRVKLDAEKAERTEDDH
jgi:hypothetical protein